MNLPDIPGKINFLIAIHVNYKDSLTGGIMAMHKLAHELAIRGHNVYIFADPEYPHENITKIESTIIKKEGFIETFTWEHFYYPIYNTVSVYPQIIQFNPFNTKHVVRWILHDTESHHASTFEKDDVFFNFGNFKSHTGEITKKLTVFDYHLDQLYITNFGKRNGFCYMPHKYTPPAGDDFVKKITQIDLRNWKQLGNYPYLREQLNKYEYMLTYDQKSFYPVAAGLCGCKSIILNPGKPFEHSSASACHLYDAPDLTPTEFRMENPIHAFGVAYGWDDISWANKTIELVRNHIIELQKIDDKTVDEFVKFWEKKIYGDN